MLGMSHKSQQHDHYLPKMQDHPERFEIQQAKGLLRVGWVVDFPREFRIWNCHQNLPFQLKLLLTRIDPIPLTQLIMNLMFFLVSAQTRSMWPRNCF